MTSAIPPFPPAASAPVTSQAGADARDRFYTALTSLVEAGLTETFAAAMGDTIGWLPCFGCGREGPYRIVSGHPYCGECRREGVPEPEEQPSPSEYREALIGTPYDEHEL